MTLMRDTPMADAAAASPQQSPQQVQVKFTTRHPEISVPPAPILVPANLKRYGLSQIINHLLDASPATPFDFLVDGAFLRSSLDSYLSQNGLSSESVITLEYVRAIVPPKFQAAFQHDDWVSSVSVRGGGDGGGRILSGSYDGLARVWNLSGQVIAEAPGHVSAVKSVKWLDGDDDDDGNGNGNGNGNGGAARFVTAGMDRSLRLWAFEDDAEGNATCKVTAAAQFLGHKATVEDVVVDPASGRMLSASVDGKVGLWTCTLSESPAAPKDVLPPRSKKRKTSFVGNAPQYGPLGLLSGHSSPVSGVAFDPKDPTVAYSVSWDHTIRTWDLATRSLVDTRTTQYPLLAVCPLPSLSLLACGSSARHITLHDPRASAATVSTSTLRGHSNAVVALSANRDSQWQMVSAGHDGTLRIWDVRATASGSMYTIKREGGEDLTGKEKVFDVEWSRVGIVSGGEDKRVQINATPIGGEAEAGVDQGKEQS